MGPLPQTPSRASVQHSIKCPWKCARRSPTIKDANGYVTLKSLRKPAQRSTFPFRTAPVNARSTRMPTGYCANHAAGCCRGFHGVIIDPAHRGRAGPLRPVFPVCTPWKIGDEYASPTERLAGLDCWGSVTQVLAKLRLLNPRPEIYVNS
jgi:hypothetical protein